MPDQEDEVQKVLRALQDLASLERETAVAETNLFGVLRDRLSPVARYGDPIPIKYRVLNYNTERQSEQTAYLPEGFPTTEGAKPLLALAVIDTYGIVDIEAGKEAEAPAQGHYAGECLYLSWDRKWILAERTGAFSGKIGASNEWEAHCRILSDRALLDRYPLESVADGLLATTNKIWERVSPRMEALKRRFAKVEKVAGDMARLKGFSRETGPPEGAAGEPPLTRKKVLGS
ncbi:MAG TPA: hypothetical protein VGF06_13590 [Terriglobales bacterium]